MAFWNPKKYNPQTQDFAQGLLANAFGRQSQNPYQSISNAGQKIVAALMLRGQSKAEDRARGETMALLEEYQDMQRNKEELTSLGATMASGIQGNLGTPEELEAGAEMYIESEEEYKDRKENFLFSTLLKSEIPEFRHQGETLFLENLTKKLPGWYYTTDPKGNLVAIDKSDPTKVLDIRKSDGGQVSLTKIEPNTWYMQQDEQGNVELIPPYATQMEWSGQPVVGDNGNYLKWGENPVTGEAGLHDTGIKARPPGSLVEVNMGDKGTEKLPTAARNDLVKKAINNTVDVKRNLDVYERMMTIPNVEDFFTIPGKIEMFATQLGEKLGFDIPKERLEKLKDWAGLRAEIWMGANKYIQSITGAQVSQHEVKRLMRAIANPDDSYTVFMSKLQMAIQTGIDANDTYVSMLKDEGFTVQQAEAGAAAVFANQADYFEQFSPQQWELYAANARDEAMVRQVTNPNEFGTGGVAAPPSGRVE